MLGKLVPVRQCLVLVRNRNSILGDGIVGQLEGMGKSWL